MTTALHFVGFKGDEYIRAIMVFGLRDTPTRKEPRNMKTTILATVLLATTVIPALASNDLRQAISETGCDSRYSEDKKADIFEHKYQGQEFVTSGTVDRVKDGRLALRVLPSTLTSDIYITMSDENSIYNLEKGQRVTVKYTLTEAGGCIVDFQGDHGVLVQH
jgi:hypothetical protein